MEQENKKIRFTAFDVLITILVLALIASLVWYFVFRPKATVELPTKNISYTVVLKGVDIKTINNIQKGDTILNSSTGNSFGKVTQIKMENTQYVLNMVNELEPKEAKATSYPNLYDIYITIDSECKVETTGIATVDNNPILIGKRLYIKDGYLATSCFVVDFTIE